MARRDNSSLPEKYQHPNVEPLMEWQLKDKNSWITFGSKLQKYSYRWENWTRNATRGFLSFPPFLPSSCSYLCSIISPSFFPSHLNAWVQFYPVLFVCLFFLFCCFWWKGRSQCFPVCVCIDKFLCARWLSRYVREWLINSSRRSIYFINGMLLLWPIVIVCWACPWGTVGRTTKQATVR